MKLGVNFLVDKFKAGYINKRPSGILVLVIIHNKVRLAIRFPPDESPANMIFFGVNS